MAKPNGKKSIEETPAAATEPATSDAPAVNDAATVDELLPSLAVGNAPDMQAVADSLELETPEPAPAPGAAPGVPGSSSTAGAPGAAPGAGSSSSGNGSQASHTGPISPAPERWTRAKIRKARRPELVRRVEELQKQLAEKPAPAPGAPGAPGAPDVPGAPPLAEQMETMLDTTLPAVSAMLEYFGGKELALSGDEQKLLAQVYAPPLAPQYARAQAAVPWLPAILATAGIFVPKVLELMKTAKARDAAKRGQGSSSGTQEPEPAPGVAVALPAPQEFGRPFGGAIV